MNLKQMKMRIKQNKMKKKINLITPTTEEVVSVWEKNKILKLELNPYLTYHEIICTIDWDNNTWERLFDGFQDWNEQGDLLLGKDTYSFNIKIVHHDFKKLHNSGTDYLGLNGTICPFDNEFDKVKNITKLRNFFMYNKDIKRFLRKYFKQNIRSVVEIKKQIDGDENYLQMMGTDYLFSKEEVKLNITLSDDKSFFNIELDKSVVHCENVYEDVIDIPLTKKEINFLKDKVKRIDFPIEVINLRDVGFFENGLIEYQDCILESGDKKYVRGLHNKIKKYIRRIQNRFEDCIRKETKTKAYTGKKDLDFDSMEVYEYGFDSDFRSAKDLIGVNKKENTKVWACPDLGL